MKLNGEIRARGTIDWCDERQRFVFRKFTFVDTDPSLIELQGDDAKLFAFEDCTFIRTPKR